MKKVIILILSVLVMFVGSKASAWGPAGHKTVAAIAFRQLTPDEQKKIVGILKHHPRFSEDFEDRMPENVEENEWVFQQAAIWPDLVKGLKGDLSKEFNHPNWHFIDLPYYPTDDDRREIEPHFSLNISFSPPSQPEDSMNLVQAEKYAENVVLNSHASQGDKAMYLSWMFHLVGDAHQPLHAATLCVVDLFPEGDHGGNWIPTVQKKELHALWDGFPGSPSMKFRAVQQQAAKLLLNHDFKHAGEKAAEDLNVETWAKESHDLAERYAYATEVLTSFEGESDKKDLQPIDLSEEYLSTGGNIAKQRLVEGGFRLGAVLKKVADQQ